jgi:catechol 2,3-dioxygenase-like lactoylglutathione lyase family enzyme
MTTGIHLFSPALALIAALHASPRFKSPASVCADDVPSVQAVVSVGLTVSDLDRSVRFYRDVLTFEELCENEAAGEVLEHVVGVFGARVRTAKMRLGGETLELTEYLSPVGRPIPLDSKSNDRWFQHVAIVVRDMDQAYARLREHKVAHASTGPQTLPDWNHGAAGIRAFYFKDPDGHVLEILSFPLGKGDAKWHAAGDDLFIGIDHTAIVVGDTERSLDLYRDLLGLRLAGESENYGTEQEHLNNVFGARLRITSLRAHTGPGVELLEYLSPTGGRPFPDDARANDFVHWETALATNDIDQLASRLRSARTAFVSPGVVAGVPTSDLATNHASPDPAFAASKNLVLQDPDGHVLHLIQL